MDVHEWPDLAEPVASALLAELWLVSHALLVGAGLIYAAFVWPEPLLSM
jgi:hypothetical protein